MICRNRALAVCASILFAAVAACTSGGGQGTPTVHQMGEQVQLGALVYDVAEVDWQPALGGQPPQSADHRFAILRLTIRNTGGEEVRPPLLQMADDKGAATMELTQVRGLDDWLGIFRTLKPGETMQGRIVFELKPQNYRLRVTDAGEPEVEKTAWIRVPLRLNSPEPAAGLPEPEAMAPSK